VVLFDTRLAKSVGGDENTVMLGVMINLSLAVFWLFLGGAILASEAIHGPQPYRPFGVSIGWWVMLLTGYNGLRAWMTWLAVKKRRAWRESEEDSRMYRRRRDRSEEPPDPNFQFTEEPRKTEKPIDDANPSA
jgi:hypothetical protein